MKLLELLGRTGLAIENYIDHLGAKVIKENKREEDMCGSLKHSHWADKAPIKVGQTFPEGTVVKAEKDGTTILVKGKTVWEGFARSETVDKWIKGGWLPATLHVDGFTEKDQDFDVPDGHVIEAVILQGDKNYLNVVTRQARTETEKAIHSRWPLTKEG